MLRNFSLPTSLGEKRNSLKHNLDDTGKVGQKKQLQEKTFQTPPKFTRLPSVEEATEIN